MTAYTDEPTFQYIGQLIKTKTPIVPMLSYVKVKKNGTILKELNIIYYNQEKHALSRIYNQDFAAFMFDNLLSLDRGISSQTLVGIVRASKPDMIEKWKGDTIEKVNHESFSLYRGLLSIIGKNDGLPLVIPEHSGIVGDIFPGIKQLMNGKNPTKVHQMTKKFETLQNKIAHIIGDNPYRSGQIIADTTEFSFKQEFQDLSAKQISRIKRLKKL